MKTDHELDEILRELRRLDPETIDRVLAAARQTAGRSRWKARLLQSVVAAGLLAFLILSVRYFAPAPEAPGRIARSQPDIAKADDRELMRWVDGLLDKDIPSAFEPARLVAREFLKSGK